MCCYAAIQVGFVNALFHEVSYGDTIMQQATELSVGSVMLLAMWVYASMVPILKGVKNEPFGG